MTKQPPYATKLRLSRICRWLLALGAVKLCIFGALVAGYPLPELSFDALRGNKTQNTAPKPEAKANAMATMDTLLAQSGKPLAAQPEDAPSAAPQPEATRPGNEPQGAAAARAAAAMGNALGTAQASAPPASLTAAPATQALSSATAQASATAPAVIPAAAIGATGTTGAQGGPDMTAYPVTDATASAPHAGDDKGWWSHIQQLKALPFPRLGLDQVAHAATLDTPPPPTLPNTGGAAGGAFTPPAQIPSGVNPDGSPIPPRPSTAQPRPAGTSGPQFDRPAESGVSTMLKPTTNVPAPKTDAYVAPEDPNRKQQELARREQEVLVLKQQMEQRLEELQAAERKVQGLLEEAKEVEAKKISRLASIYINMKPKQAAKALESMDERTAVKILAGMSPKQSGEILTYADPVKTAKLTEIISRMRTGQ